MLLFDQMFFCHSVHFQHPSRFGQQKIKLKCKIKKYTYITIFTRFTMLTEAYTYLHLRNDSLF